MSWFENETHEEDPGEAKRRVPTNCVNDGIAKREFMMTLIQKLDGSRRMTLDCCTTVTDSINTGSSAL